MHHALYWGHLGIAVQLLAAGASMHLPDHQVLIRLVLAPTCLVTGGLGSAPDQMPRRRAAQAPALTGSKCRACLQCAVLRFVDPAAGSHTTGPAVEGAAGLSAGGHQRGAVCLGQRCQLPAG